MIDKAYVVSHQGIPVRICLNPRSAYEYAMKTGEPNTAQGGKWPVDVTVHEVPLYGEGANPDEKGSSSS